MEVLFAGMTDGVWYATSSDWTRWRQFGTLSNAPVSALLFDPQDNLLAVSLFGRGIFTATDFSSITPVPEPSAWSLGLLALAGGTVLLAYRKTGEALPAARRLRS